MMKYGKAYGGSDPELIEGDVFRIVVKVPELGTIETKGVAANQVTPEVRKMLSIMAGEMTRREMQEKLGLKDEKHFREKYQQVGVELRLIEMTIPDKPNSRLQKYRLTSDGSFHARKDEYGVKNLYRYQKLFAIAEKEAVNLFSDIPFLNGGLFDWVREEALKLACALLNSSVLKYFYDTSFPTLHVQRNELAELPLAMDMSSSCRRKLLRLVDSVLVARTENMRADTSRYERAIDQLVYKLYDLTTDEIAIVEGQNT